MRRILVVDDDLHTRLALRVWLKQCGRHRGRRAQRPCGARRRHVRPDDRRYLHAEHARFRIDQDISPARPDGPADRNFRLCLLRARNGKSCLPQNGSQPRRTRCLRKPFRPTTLLSVIDECLSEAEPHRRYAATLAAVTTAPSEQQGTTASSDISKERIATG